MVPVPQSEGGLRGQRNLHAAPNSGGKVYMTAAFVGDRVKKVKEAGVSGNKGPEGGRRTKANLKADWIHAHSEGREPCLGNRLNEGGGRARRRSFRNEDRRNRDYVGRVRERRSVAAGYLLC